MITRRDFVKLLGLAGASLYTATKVELAAADVAPEAVIDAPLSDAWCKIGDVDVSKWVHSLQVDVRRLDMGLQEARVNLCLRNCPPDILTPMPLDPVPFVFGERDARWEFPVIVVAISLVADDLVDIELVAAGAPRRT